jgi:Holliday junction resolvase RusA-like endonuclease
MLTIELPFPVTANAYWMIAGRRLIKTKRARAYIAEVVLYWLNAKLLGARSFGEDETLAMSVAIHYPVRKGPDCDVDNLLKVLVDAMETAGIYQNDRQIRFIQISREKAKDKTIGSVRVNIKSCPHEMELNDRNFRVEEVHNDGEK